MRKLWWSFWESVHALLVLLLWPLRWTAWGQRRVQFESIMDPTELRADWAFEVSSEGEYEQVRTWITDLAEQGLKLELVFASESVEPGMRALQARYPGQVRLLRLPLLTHRFGSVQNFLTAPRLVMCRYDFFPALMRQAARQDVQSGLVWGTFKNRRGRFLLPGWRGWCGFFYGAFDWIIPATAEDETLFRSVHPRVLATVDFRIGQIRARLAAAPGTLQKKFPHWEDFQKILQSFPQGQRVLFGSLWESDLPILQNESFRAQVLAGKMLVMLAPHQLKDEWVQLLEELGYPVHHIKAGLPLPPARPGLWLINLRGVLCELYGEVGKVYVGGGFERSVHSVMEPFVAGAQVWCGPKIHRSTEVELIQSVEPQALQVSADHQHLGQSLAQSIHDAQRADLRPDWLENQIRMGREITARLKENSA